MKKKRKSISHTLHSAVIETTSHDGRGIARLQGKTTFIANALPQEEVLFRYTQSKAKFDEGYAIEIIQSNPERVQPICQHAAWCGGCSLQHLAVSAQIQLKENILRELFQNAGIQPKVLLPPLVAEHQQYRSKARLSVRYVEKKAQVLVGFREKHHARLIADIQMCPILDKRINSLLIPLQQVIASLTAFKDIAQIEAAAGDEQTALIFRHLKPLTEADRDRLRQFGSQHDIQIYLQPGGVETITLLYPEQALPELSYHLPDYSVQFKFHPADFTQVNPSLNRKMVAQAIQWMQLEPQDAVLDLFCGLGNFSLPMARFCQKLIGIEGSRQMVARAMDNAQHNAIHNASFFETDLTQPDALDRWQNHKITKLLLDPPRCGAIDIVQQIHKINPQRIVYISCNPTTLVRDAKILVEQAGYCLEAIGVMDMFPHTAHVESMAVFTLDKGR